MVICKRPATAAAYAVALALVVQLAVAQVFPVEEASSLARDPSQVPGLLASWTPAGLAAMGVADTEKVPQATKWVPSGGSGAAAQRVGAFSEAARPAFHADDGFGSPYLDYSGTARGDFSTNLFAAGVRDRSYLVRFRTTDQHGHLVGTASNTATAMDYGFGIVISAGRVAVHANSAPGSPQRHTSQGIASDGRWHEVLFSIDSGGLVKLYFDGALLHTILTPASIWPYTLATLCVAQGSGGTGTSTSRLDAEISHVLVWDSVLPDDLSEFYPLAGDADWAFPDVSGDADLIGEWDPAGLAALPGVTDGASLGPEPWLPSAAPDTAAAGQLTPGLTRPVYRANDGSGQAYLALTDDSNLLFSQNHFCQDCTSRTFMVRFRTTQADGMLVGTTTASGSHVMHHWGFGMGLVGGFLASFAISGNSGHSARSRRPVNDGLWHKAAVTYGRAGAGEPYVLTLSVDGVAQSSHSDLVSNIYPYTVAAMGSSSSGVFGLAVHVSHFTAVGRDASTADLGLAVGPSSCGGSEGVPVLDDTAPASSLDGNNLQLSWTSASDFDSLTWAFDGAASGLCDNGGADGGGWTHTARTCNTLHVMSLPLVDVLRECGFGRLDAATDEDNFVYEATLTATSTKTVTSVFATPAPLVERTAFTTRVLVPKSAGASADVTVFPSARAQVAVTQQLADTTSKRFEWSLAAAVQHPYELVAPAQTSNTPAGFAAPLAVATAAGSESCSGTGACVQTFTVSGTSTACDLDGTAELTFEVRCRGDAGASCDLPAVEEAPVAFTYSTDRFCPEVVEVAEVVPTLTAYSNAARTTPAVDYVLQSTLYGRVSLKVEGDVDVTGVELRRLDIASNGETTVTAVLDGASQEGTVGAMSLDLATQAGTANDVDFSFLLNDNSVKFPGGAATGQSSVVLTATVRVTYTDADSQAPKQRDVRLSAAAATTPSVSASASTNFGVGAQPSSTSSSSTAGSSVLGVSAGVAAVAAASVVAVLAVAAGVAVAAKKRRRAAHEAKLASSSSSAAIQLQSVEVTAQAAAPAPGAVMPADDLRGVQTAYGECSV